MQFIEDRYQFENNNNQIISKKMDDINESSSLEIVQPEHNIIFSSDSNIEQSLDQAKDDELDYSKDQPSLSFMIEQQKKNNQNFQQENISNDPPKRKRKQIFQKFKPNRHRRKQQLILQNEEQDDDVLKTFDQIFKINTPRSENQTPIKNYNSPPTNQYLKQAFTKKRVSQPEEIPPYKFVHQNAVNTKQTQLGSQTTRLNQIQLKKQNNCTDKQLNSPQTQNHLFDSSAFFDTPFKQGAQKARQSINISEIGGGISFIENRHNYSLSKDIDQIANILNFNNQVNDQKKEQQIAKRQDIKTTNNINKVDDLGQSRSTFRYQNIDMSSSINPSLMMKQSQMIGQSQSQNQFLGNSPLYVQKRAQTMHDLFTNENRQSQQFYKIRYNKIRQNLEQLKRYPLLLQPIRKLNQTYPNFHNQFFKKMIVAHENDHLNKLIRQTLSAIKIIQSLCLFIDNWENQKKQLSQMINSGISVKLFLQIQWSKLQFPKQLELVRPRQKFQYRPWKYKKARDAITNYQKIAEYYNQIRLNLKDQRGIKKYFDIRQKFWVIQRNLKMISEDIYAHIVFHQIDQHYFAFHQILQQEQQFFFCQTTQATSRRTLIQKIRYLQQNNQKLASSSVGEAVLDRLYHWVKFHSSY